MSDPRARGASNDAPLAGESNLRLGRPEYLQLKQDVACAYDRAADDYDQVGTRRFRRFGRELVDRLDLAPDMRVLDVGTGRGAILFPVAANLGPSGRAVGVDLALKMIVHTHAEAERQGLDNVHVQQMDADALAFAADSFDVITCGFALFFVDFENVLASLYQVLRPGGTLVVSVNHSLSDPDEYERWKWLFPLLREVMGPGFRPPAACVAPLRLATPDRLSSVLEQAGFTDVRLETVQATLYFKDEQDWWRHELSQGSRMWADGMSDEARETYRRKAFEHLKGMKSDRGIRVVDGAMLAFATKPHTGRRDNSQ